MKLQAKSALLLKQALQKSFKCIDPKASMAILSNVLLTQRKEDKKFFFVSATTDSQLTVPAPLELVEGDFTRDAVLPIAEILSLLGTLPPDCVVLIDLSEGKDVYSMKIDYCTQSGKQAKAGNVTMGFFSAEDYPQLAKFGDSDIHISLPQETFMNVLSHAGKFVAADELRPVMNCLCIDVAGDFSDVNFVATSGHILIKITHTNNPETGGSDFYRDGKPCQILVHSSYFKTLSVFGSGNCEDVDVECNGSAVRFTSGDIEYLCKKVDSKYPNYNSVIPRNNPFFVCVGKKELMEVIKRVSLFGSESSNLVKLKKDGMFLNLSAEDIDFSTFADDQVLIMDSKCQEGFQIGFKASSLIDVLAAIPSDTVRIQLADPSRAGIITADDPAPKVLTLLMPMMLNV